MDFHGLFHFDGFLATLRSGTLFIAIASPNRSIDLAYVIASVFVQSCFANPFQSAFDAHWVLRPVLNLLYRFNGFQIDPFRTGK